MKFKHLLFLIAMSGVLGLMAGFITVLFVASLDFIHQIIWTDIPNAFGGGVTNLYIVGAALVGGLLVGLCQKYFGSYPKLMDEALVIFQRTKKFDYKHLPQSILASFAALGFGGSLGPEAILITLIGGLGSWIGDIIKRFSALGELAFVSISASIGAMFGSPVGGAALSSYGLPKSQRSKTWLYVPALSAGLASFWVFKTFSNGGFFDYNYLPYSFEVSDIWISALLAVVASGLGLFYLLCEKYMDKLVKKLSLPTLWQTLAGGLVLGLLASFSGYILFSGHEAIQEIMDQTAVLTGATLITVAFLKVIATSWLLSTGWKGGKFFPTMFAGAALGLGLSHLISSIDPMVGLCVGMASALSATLQKPVAALLLLMFFFPSSMYLLIVVGAVVGGVISKKLMPIPPKQI